MKKGRKLLLEFIVASISVAPVLAAQWIEWPRAAGGNGHAYLPVAVASPISWDEASRQAQNHGGYLATITSEAENAFVYALVRAEQYWAEDLGPLLGGYQPPGSAEPAGGWTWLSGEPWTYSNWSLGQPDNGDIPSEDGLCFRRDGTWNDRRTNQAVFASYLVERDICTPRKARATAQIVNGFLVSATLTEPGCGYTNPPIVLIQGGGGRDATAQAIVSDGAVTEIKITDAGCCYTSTPRIVISSPPMVPSVEIQVSKLKVIQNVVLGWKYVLESSANNIDWTATGPAFTAETDPIETEFPAERVGRFFRLRVVP